MTPPLVSVLIPTYNSAKYVERAISSVVGQSYANLQIVLQDNASTDETIEIAHQYARQDRRISCDRSATNVGPLRNWQTGLERCAGDYVKVLWSDDWIHRDFVDECVAMLERSPEMSFVFTAVMLHHPMRDEPLYLHPHRDVFTTSEYLAKTFARDNMPVSPGCSLVRRKYATFKVPGGATASLQQASERWGAGPDLLFLLEAACGGQTVGYIPKFYGHFLARADSFSGAHQAGVAAAYRETCKLAARDARKRFPKLHRMTLLAGAGKWLRGQFDRSVSLLARALRPISKG